MKSLWLESDYYQNIKMNAVKIPLRYNNSLKERIFLFLASLNVEHDQVRVHILEKGSLSYLKEVFSIIRAEEGRRSVRSNLN